MVEEPNPKKKIKLYAYVSKDVLGVTGLTSIFCAIYYSIKDELNNHIRLPALDQEIEVEDND